MAATFKIEASHPEAVTAISTTTTSNSIMNSTTHEARPMLHVLIGKKKWSEARKRIESNPEECKVWVITEFGSVGSERPWWKRLPIHIACERKPDDVRIVKDLIDSFPESALMTDENKKVPLIHACCRHAPLEIVEVLLAKCPEAAYSPDAQDRFALHWACEYDATWDVVSLLLSSYPDASKHVDRYGRVPLHWECVSFKCNPQTVCELVQYYPSAVCLQDFDGNTPLDLMEHSLSPEKEKVIDILKSYE